MRADCHIHMVLDGENWKAAIARHKNGPDEAWIRKTLELYREKGFTYLRDGGDRWGAGKCVRKLSKDYGITYLTPLAPLCREGHYGGFIGRKFGDLREYRGLVEETREEGGDFIKVMISGLMDFDECGRLTEAGLSDTEIQEMIHIAHEEGFSVMAHANGARVVRAAAAAGVDSVEHGAYLDDEALAAMAENGVVWCPTLSTIGNLRGKGRFREEAVRDILRTAQENVGKFAALGGLIAPGDDAGAWAVPHGCDTEEGLLREVLGVRTEATLNRGIRAIMEKF